MTKAHDRICKSCKFQARKGRFARFLDRLFV